MEEAFPGEFLEVLDFWGSDHRVLLIDTENHPTILPSRSYSRRRWAFELGWLTNEECHEVIRGAWTRTPSRGKMEGVSSGWMSAGKLYEVVRASPSASR